MVLHPCAPSIPTSVVPHYSPLWPSLTHHCGPPLLSTVAIHYPHTATGYSHSLPSQSTVHTHTHRAKLSPFIQDTAIGYAAHTLHLWTGSHNCLSNSLKCSLHGNNSPMAQTELVTERLPQLASDLLNTVVQVPRNARWRRRCAD